jgi:signal transduction histidine kinase
MTAARRPRILLGLAVVGFVVVLGALGLALQHNRNSERDGAQRRFANAATVTASLTRSVFSSSAPGSAQQIGQLLGAREVSQAALDKKASTDRVDYALVLDTSGQPLATTQAVPPAARQRIAGRPDYLRRVLTGVEPYRLSSFVDDSTLEYAIRFNSDAGPRVLVEGFSANLVGGLFHAYFEQLPDAGHQAAAIVDSQNRTVVGPPGQPIGQVAALRSDDRTTVQAPIGGTEWRVVLSQRDAYLYRGISNLVWLVLFALALAGLAAIVLLVRAIRRDHDLQATYAELERMNVELRRSNAELAEFASVASHDLQEPLRKVLGFGVHLERRYAEELSGDAVDLVRRMRAAAERMSVLIDDLLGFSRVTTHAEPPARIELSALAEEVVSDLGALIADTDGRVEVRDLPAVSADAVQMRQLLQNLIANGLKFHRPGVAPAVVIEAVAAPPGRVRFTVSDNGIGFEPDYAEKIFGVFERLHPRDVYEGTGIGLAVCRKIVERHGGTITATSRAGAGAVFTVELPAAAVGMPVREPVHA